jgi:hypothetical protein
MGFNDGPGALMEFNFRKMFGLPRKACGEEMHITGSLVVNGEIIIHCGKEQRCG